jgi:hypothetical protein
MRSGACVCVRVRVRVRVGVRVGTILQADDLAFAMAMQEEERAGALQEEVTASAHSAQHREAPPRTHTSDSSHHSWFG